MLLSALPFTGLSAFAAESEFKYYLVSDDAIIEGYTGNSTSIVIPATLGGHRVTEIDMFAFKNNKTIKSVKIPEGVEEIGKEAFLNCENLTEINLPDSVNSIGLNAFTNTGYANNAVRENGVLYIGKHLINADASLSGNYTVKPNTVSIGERAFAGCTDLTGVTLPEGVTVIPEAAFLNCKNLSKLETKGKIKVVQTGAFVNCTKLRSFDFSGLEEIYRYALQDCGIEEFNITPKLKKVQDLVFYKSGIKRFTGGNSTFTVKNGVLFTDNATTLYQFPTKSDMSEYTVPSGVKIIASSAFINSTLKKLTLSEGITYLGSSAFQQMTNLKEITIPDSVTEAGIFTFHGCEALEKVTFGKGLKSTTYQMFMNCKKLKTVDFGGIEEIDNQTFRGCGIEALHLPKTVKYTGLCFAAYCTSLKSFKADGITSVPTQAFYGCTALSDVELNENFKVVGFEAFKNCTALKKFNSPKSIEFIDSEAFPETTEVICNNEKLSPYGLRGYRKMEKAEIRIKEDYDSAYKVLEIINKRRAENGLGKLVMNESLLKTAMLRAKEATLLYDHTRPDGTLCFTANPLMYAENIALGQETPESVMEAWMNSKGHRENILTADFKTVGIGCVYHNGRLYWTQCFGKGSDTSNCKKPVNTDRLAEVSFATDEFAQKAQDRSAISSILAKKAHYHLVPKIKTDSSRIAIGTSQKVKLVVENGGAPGSYALLDNGSASWSTSSPCIELSGSSVTAKAEGTGSITAKMFLSTVTYAMTAFDKAKEDAEKAKEKESEKKDYISEPITKQNYSSLYNTENKNAPSNYKAPAANTKASMKAEINSVISGKRYIKIRIKKVKGADGYQVQYSNKKNMKNSKKKAFSASKKTLKINKLKRHKKYYVRVRAYKLVNGKKVYGSWSGKFKVKTR